MWLILKTSQRVLKTFYLKYFPNFCMPQQLEKKFPLVQIISLSGLCSRKEAKQLVLDLKVEVDRKLISSPNFKVSETANIKVDSKPLKKKPKLKLWIFNKPKEVITSHKDERGRKTVFDLLPKTLGRVISIGRLDYNTEGLLLITNNGSFARFMELPQNKFKRKYIVKVSGKVTDESLNAMRKGCSVGGMRYEKIQVTVDKKIGSQSFLTITLTEGKNREIRNILSHFKLRIKKLLRLEYGPYKLGKLKSGVCAQVPVKNNLMQQYLKTWIMD